MNKPYLTPSKPKGALYWRSLSLAVEFTASCLALAMVIRWGSGTETTVPLIILGWAMLIDTIEVITLSVRRFRRLPNWALLIGEFLALGAFAFLLTLAYFMSREMGDGTPYEVTRARERDPNYVETAEDKAAEAEIQDYRRRETAEWIFWVVAALLHCYFFIRISVDSCIQRRSKKWQAGFKQSDNDHVALAASPPRPKPKGALYGRSFLLTIELACLGMLVGLIFYSGHNGAATLAFAGLGWSIILDTAEIVTLFRQRFRRLPTWALLIGDFGSIAMFGPLMFIAYWTIYEYSSENGVEVDPNEGYHAGDPGKEAAMEARVRTSQQLELAECLFWILILTVHIFFFIRVSVDGCIRRRSKKWQAGFKKFDDGDNVALQTLPSSHERIAGPELAADPHHARTLHKGHEE